MFADFSLLSYLFKAGKNIFTNGAVVLFYIVRKKKIYIYIYIFFSMSSLVLFCFPFACYYNEKIDRKRWEDIDDSHLRGTDLVAHWNNPYFSFLCSPHVSKMFFPSVMELFYYTWYSPTLTYLFLFSFLLVLFLSFSVLIVLYSFLLDINGIDLFSYFCLSIQSMKWMKVILAVMCTT